eukprot:CAMPEP_0205944244 /NCGR_PEP_ID=MMETSP1325-20131115/62684_1 /ASSEMBLY_ACC=CAM_ASM_000708 /TAXON_ID=236786 /ORGANISM="Florenciella sp., Strain RCC1007" /LENGTH=57 /DNA_ID=CAMNT_0053315123 /DNA_START=97 /DNA_END=266 /DNA_ORIENTATION=-
MTARGPLAQRHHKPRKVGWNRVCFEIWQPRTPEAMERAQSDYRAALICLVRAVLHAR